MINRLNTNELAPGFWPDADEQAHRGITLTALRLLQMIVDEEADLERVEDWLDNLQGHQLWADTPGEQMRFRMLMTAATTLGIPEPPPGTYDYQRLSQAVAESCREEPPPTGELAAAIYGVNPLDTPLMRHLDGLGSWPDIAPDPNSPAPGQRRPLTGDPSPVRTGVPAGGPEALWGRLERVCPAGVRIGDRAFVVIHSAFTWDIAIIDLCAPHEEGMKFLARWGYVGLKPAIEAFKIWGHNDFRDSPPAPSKVYQELK